MATLKNKNNDTFIELKLTTTKESPNWIGYGLRVLTKKENVLTEFLRLNYANDLCFDNALEPEIPMLLQGLNSIIKNTINSYIFEPIDEKDFSLEIKQEHATYLTTLFMEEALAFDNYQWNTHAKIGIQMQTGKDDITEFIYQLKKEFNKLNLMKI